MCSRSRDTLRPSFASWLAPQENQGRSATLKRGRGECRVSDAPVVCAKCTVVPQVHRSQPAFPARWFYGFLRALPGDRAFLSPSPADRSADLTPASRRQDHTTSPSAATRLRQRLRRACPSSPRGFAGLGAARPHAVKRATTLLRPPHPVPRFVTIASRPSCGTRRQGYASDLPRIKSGKFFAKGLDRFLLICPSCYFVAGRCINPLLQADANQNPGARDLASDVAPPTAVVPARRPGRRGMLFGSNFKHFHSGARPEGRGRNPPPLWSGFAVTTRAAPSPSEVSRVT
jgi:hypothetical protein